MKYNHSNFPTLKTATTTASSVRMLRGIVSCMTLIVSVSWMVSIMSITTLSSSLEQQQQQQQQQNLRQNGQQQQQQTIVGANHNSVVSPLSQQRHLDERIQKQQNNQVDTTTAVVHVDYEDGGTIMKGNYNNHKGRHNNHNNRYYNFTTAICLITTDGEAYFQEWVDYHLFVMNFDAIYVYDNSRKFDLKRWYTNTRSHPIYQNVVVHHRPGPGYNTITKKHLQSEVYEDCIRRYGQQDTTTTQANNDGPQHDYFALIDIDEFLVPQQEKYYDGGIHSILEEYLVPYGGSLVSNWVLFGSANRTVYSPVPVTKRFQYRDLEVHNVIKSIVKAVDYHSQRNPHSVKLKRPDINLPHTSEYPGAIQSNIYDPKDRTKASSWAKAKDVLLVYHYRYTSDKEYYYKRCIRDGLVGHWCDKSSNKIKNDTRTPDHVQSRPGELMDDTAWMLLKRYVPKYRVYDTPDWEDFF